MKTTELDEATAYTLPRSMAEMGTKWAETVTVSLNPKAAEMLKWACNFFGQRPDEVINAALWEMDGLREEYTNADETNLVPWWYGVMASVTGERIEREDAAGGAAEESGMGSPLTVTLDAKAGDCVRRFAAEFREDLGDVASGAILDTLPQALAEWEDTKKCREAGSPATALYWEGVAESVRQARTRRA